VPVRRDYRQPGTSPEKAFALPIQFHKPIIGENLFAREVDDDVEKMMAQPLLFEPFPPEIIGREVIPQVN
jgi:isopropylmalate/homocitrate/citramalate synthase